LSSNQTATSTAARRGSGRIHLTRRGRVVFTTLAAAPFIALAAWFGLGGGSAIASSSTSSTSFDYVTVEYGDSLWSIASDVAPEADPRDVIADVMSLNQLESSTVVPGQRIALPERYTAS
jgi:predicted small integral membrane protein